MKKTAEKVLKTGFGLGLLSLKQAEKVAGRVRSELALSEKESLQLAKQLVASSRKVSDDVLKVVGKSFEQAVVGTGLVKKNDLKVVKNVLKRRVKKRNAGVKKGSKKTMRKK